AVVVVLAADHEYRRDEAVQFLAGIDAAVAPQAGGERRYVVAAFFRESTKQALGRIGERRRIGREQRLGHGIRAAFPIVEIFAADAAEDKPPHAPRRLVREPQGYVSAHGITHHVGGL